MLKILIAEDDPSMRNVLKKVIGEVVETNIVGEAHNGLQLIQMVEELKPDVIFVDVDMPEKNGVDAAKEVFDINPNIFIIFATAFDNYTHEAFDVYAFDYLVKPFKLDRIKKTVERVKRLKAERDTNEILLRPLGQMGHRNSKLMFQTNDKCIFINMLDIIMATRNERKTAIFTTQGQVTTYQSLQELQKRLDPNLFFRCHKGFIVNQNMIVELVPWGNKTYLAKLLNTKQTALMTLEKAREFKDKFCNY